MNQCATTARSNLVKIINISPIQPTVVKAKMWRSELPCFVCLGRNVINISIARHKYNDGVRIKCFIGFGTFESYSVHPYLLDITEWTDVKMSTFIFRFLVW